MVMAARIYPKTAWQSRHAKAPNMDLIVWVKHEVRSCGFYGKNFPFASCNSPWGSLFAVKIDECTMPPRVPFDSEKCNHTQYIHQKLHEHLSVWRSFRTLVGAFFWHYLVITMRWFHCGFHFSKFIQPSAPTRALLPPVTVTNKQQSEIPIFPMQCHEADVLHRCMGCAWCWWHRSQRGWSQWRQGCQRRGGLRSQRRCRHLCSQHWTLEDFRIWLH